MSPPRVLVMGGTGMLGHKVFQTFQQRGHNVWSTIRHRRTDTPWNKMDFLHGDTVLENADLSDADEIATVVRDMRPDVIVNCVGVIKQRADAQSAVPSIQINALLPHMLAEIARPWKGRVIHVSSDCVFSGDRGNYTEDDASDAGDLYGRSKYLGEVASGNVLTLRTSIIGRELHHHESLLDWFLRQNHRTVKGFRRAWWSGVTTIHLADLIVRVVEEFPAVEGLYHVSSGRMSKYELLTRLRDGYGLDVDIQPDNELFCDRSLDGRRLREAIGYEPPSWDSMIADLVADPTPYTDWVGFP